MIIDKTSTGHYNSKLITTLGSKITRLNKKFTISYIGITHDPEKRIKNHSNEKKFDHMILIYRSESEKYVKKIEKFLITKHKETINNKNGGGGGSLPIDYYKFVYVLVSARKVA